MKCVSCLCALKSRSGLGVDVTIIFSDDIVYSMARCTTQILTALSKPLVKKIQTLVVVGANMK